MKTFSHLETMSQLKRHAIFRIPTETRGIVWMHMTAESGTAVVEVDAERFVDAWRRRGSDHQEIAHQTDEGWRRDPKFLVVEKCFSHGWSNPVPLATVSPVLDCRHASRELATTKRSWLWSRQAAPVPDQSIALASESMQCISFTDGVTRTIWLLAAGATRFPVSCGARDADLLHHIVGADGTGPCSASELVPEIDHLEKLEEDRRYRRKLEENGLPLWLG